MTEAVNEVEQPQITLVDLQNTLRIIDVACERGAFKGHEMTSIGGVRDKLGSFLDAVMPKEETQEEVEPEEEVSEPVTKSKSKTKK